MCWKQNLRKWRLKKRTLASQEICLYKILLDSRTFYQCTIAQDYLAFMQKFVKYFTHTKMRFFVSSHHFFFLHFLSKFQIPIFPHQPTNQPTVLANDFLTLITFDIVKGLVGWERPWTTNAECVTYQGRKEWVRGRHEEGGQL